MEIRHLLLRAAQDLDSKFSINKALSKKVPLSKKSIKTILLETQGNSRGQSSYHHETIKLTFVTL